jgi:hypothetical protein
MKPRQLVSIRAIEYVIVRGRTVFATILLLAHWLPNQLLAQPMKIIVPNGMEDVEGNSTAPDYTGPWRSLSNAVLLFVLGRIEEEGLRGVELK